MPPVSSVETAPLDDRGFVLFVEMHKESPLGQALYAKEVESDGLFLFPSLLRDGKLYLRWVGNTGKLSDAFEGARTEISDGIESITEVRLPLEETSVLDALTARQREVAQTAVSMGYYAIPRRATHDDIAEELGCSAPTVTEHLRKAESRLFGQMFPMS